MGDTAKTSQLDPFWIADTLNPSADGEKQRPVDLLTELAGMHWPGPVQHHAASIGDVTEGDLIQISRDGQVRQYRVTGCAPRTATTHQTLTLEPA